MYEIHLLAGPEVRLGGKVLKTFGRGGIGRLLYSCSRTLCSQLKADVRLYAIV